MQRFFALENESVEGQQPDGEVFDAVLAQSELSNNQSESETAASVVAAIEQVCETLEANIAAGTATPAVVNMANTAIESHLARLGHTRESLGLESYNGDDPRLALEAGSDSWNAVFQSQVISFKHTWDITADVIKGVRGRLSKYRERLVEAEDEFKSDRAKFNDDTVRLSLNELWYHFSNEKGQVNKLAEAVRKDVDFSEYALSKYPQEVIKYMDDLAAALRTAPRDEKTFISVIDRIEKLKHPAEIFDHTYVGGYKLLSHVGLVVNEGSVRDVVTVGDHSCVKLAKLAAGTIIEETASVKHFAKKFGSNALPYGKIIDNSTTISVTVSLSDVDSILKDCHRSLEVVKDYLDLEHRFKASQDRFTGALETFVKGAAGANLTGKAYGRVIKQIEQAGMAALKCFASPASTELYRALKGVKYCAYAIRRIDYNITR